MLGQEAGLRRAIHCSSITPFMLPFTFFNVQDLTGIDLNLHFPISLVFAEPAVAREHVLHPMNRYGDLHAVQKPPSPQTFVGVTNQKTADLQSETT